jgi:hypothetical protein
MPRRGQAWEQVGVIVAGDAERRHCVTVGPVSAINATVRTSRSCRTGSRVAATGCAAIRASGRHRSARIRDGAATYRKGPAMRPAPTPKPACRTVRHRPLPAPRCSCASLDSVRSIDESCAVVLSWLIHP